MGKTRKVYRKRRKTLHKRRSGTKQNSSIEANTRRRTAKSKKVIEYKKK